MDEIMCVSSMQRQDTLGIQFIEPSSARIWSSSIMKMEQPTVASDVLPATKTSEHMSRKRLDRESRAVLEEIDITQEQIDDIIRMMVATEEGRQESSDETLEAQGIVLNIKRVEVSLPIKTELEKQPSVSQEQEVEHMEVKNDFFARLKDYPELILEIAKYLRVKDYVSLFAISKDFHLIIKSCLYFAMRTHVKYNAQESSKIFTFTFFDDLCAPDPDGLPHPTKASQIRKVPGLRWLQMVNHREKTIRDILACMARQGHRMPLGMSLTLKKMWLLMDIATSARRAQLMHSDYFTNQDLYNIEFFIIKLDMRFNDPINGPADEGLRELMLGQRGLTPLCKLLKRTAFTESIDIMKLSIRYEFNVWPEHVGLPMFDIPPHEIGIGHLEGWGAGRVHLMRPDELVVHESVKRQLNLKEHLMMMMLWGYVDPITCNNIGVTEEEVYMSDNE